MIFSDVERFYAWLPIHMERDVRDLEVELKPGPSVTGQVRLPSGASTRNLQVGLARIDEADERVVTDFNVSSTGEFHIRSVRPGRYFPFASALYTSGLQLESVVLDGRELTDKPLEVGSSGISNLVITMSTTAVPLVSGIVRDSRHEPVRYAHVIAVPTDPELQIVARGARRLQAQPTRRDGSYGFRLPAGDYRIIALNAIDLGDWPSREAIDRLSRLAPPVRIQPGGKQTLDLTLIDTATVNRHESPIR